MIGVLLLSAIIIPTLQPPTPAATAQPAVVPSYVPQRVFDTRQKDFSDFEAMLADLTRADVVFVGEQHDDANTHRLELAVLEGLVRRGAAVVVAMEMFERDVQPVLDQYLAGTVTEEQFLAASRPWPRYRTDYRPIVEFAKAHQIPVTASNVPRPIAADVAKNGLGIVDALGASRAQAARDVQCPTSGDYYKRFLEVMGAGAHPPADARPGDPKGADPKAADAKAAEAQARNDRFYFAQCLKDETMGESVANAFEKYGARHPTILHVNGAFHSDYVEGTAASARRRLPGRRIAVISMIPVEDLDKLAPDEDDVKLGDYLVFTIKQ